MVPPFLKFELFFPEISELRVLNPSQTGQDMIRENETCLLHFLYSSVINKDIFCMWTLAAKAGRKIEKLFIYWGQEILYVALRDKLKSTKKVSI